MIPNKAKSNNDGFMTLGFKMEKRRGVSSALEERNKTLFQVSACSVCGEDVALENSQSSLNHLRKNGGEQITVPRLKIFRAAFN